MKTELLQMILCKGCNILDISNSTIVGSLNSNIKFQLRVLDLSQSGMASLYGYGPCTKNFEVLEESLFSCRSLQHLEMEGLILTPRMAASIARMAKHCKN